MPRQWDIKRRFGAFFVTFVFVFAVFGFMYSDVQKAKADAVSDFVKTVLTYIASDGTLAASATLNPEVAFVIGSMAVCCGVKFSNDQQIYNFCNGFFQYCMRNGTDANTFLKSITKYGASAYFCMSSPILTLLLSFLASQKASPSTSFTNGVAHFAVSQGQTTQTITGYKLLANMDYYFSIYSDGKPSAGQISAFNLQSMIGTTNCTLGTLVWQSGQYVQTRTEEIVTNSSQVWWNENSVNKAQVNTSFPCDVTINLNSNTDTPCGIDVVYTQSGSAAASDYSGVSVTPSSKVSGLSTGQDVYVKVPSDTTAIPTSDVVGQTDQTITQDTPISNDIPSDDTSNPPYTQPTTKIDWSPLMNIQLFDKFPFCLPWDLKTIVSGLVAPPKAPKWDIDIPMSGLHMPDWKYTIDFSQYQTAVYVIRYGELLLATGGLIFALYKIIKH